KPVTRHPQRAGSNAGPARRTLQIEPPMRAGAHTRIIAIAPVNEIVAAFGAGPRIIRYFVDGQSGSGADFLRQGIKSSGILLAGKHKRTLLMQACEGRALLDGELVE